jgi:hypothetical protein
MSRSGVAALIEPIRRSVHSVAGQVLFAMVRPSGRAVALRCFDWDRKVLVTTDATIGDRLVGRFALAL